MSIMTKTERKRKKKIQAYNRRLIKKYPWLKPVNNWNGRVPFDYDYTYTELDSMPKGWRKAFGLQMVEDIDAELRKYNRQNDYKILQIKEKYASLRWYDYGAVGEIPHIISAYENISEHVCLMCGKLDVPVIDDHGWYTPLCYDCYKKIWRDQESWHIKCQAERGEVVNPVDENVIVQAYYQNAGDVKTIPTEYYVVRDKQKVAVDISDIIDRLRRRRK